jgi:hypothetical protein
MRQSLWNKYKKNPENSIRVMVATLLRARSYVYDKKHFARLFFNKKF